MEPVLAIVLWKIVAVAHDGILLVGEYEIILAVALVVGGIGRPHESVAMNDETNLPAHVGVDHIGVEKLAVVGPVDHILRGEDVVAVHAVASAGGLHVVGGVDVECIGVGFPHVGRWVGGVEVALKLLSKHR